MTRAIADSPNVTSEFGADLDTREVSPSIEGFPEPTVEPQKAIWLDDEGEAADRFEERTLEISPLVRAPHIQPPRRRFRLLQHWECVVSEVTRDSVWADIVDLTVRSRLDEVVELPLDDFVEADRHLLGEGSVFYWTIGYEQSEGGQVRRVSEVRVRRTPKWTAHAIKRLEAKAQAMLERFGGHAQNDTSAT